MLAGRPEYELLRLCVRRRLAPADTAALQRLLDASLDWPSLLEVAGYHQLVPLLADGLAAAGEGAVPGAALAAIEQRRASILARNRQLACELVRLHRRAAAAGIPLLSFKGPTLAAAVYGDLGLRQFGDLDVLVDRPSSVAAETLLAELGYRHARDHGYEVKLVDDTTGIAVDVHRALSPDNFPVATSFARLWERRQVVPLPGGGVEALSPGDLLMAACIEMVKDARQGKVRLGKISDLAHVLAATRDWAGIEAEARRLGIQRVIGFGIALVADVLALAVPAPASLTSLPAPLTVFHREARAALVHGPKGQRPTRRHGDRFHFHVREHWRDRLRPYALGSHRLLTPNRLDREALPLPRWLSPLYYLVRPVRLAHVYGRRLTRSSARL